MKKTLLALAVAATSLFTSTAAQAYTLYSDNDTSLRVYGYLFTYRDISRQAGYDAEGKNSLTKFDYLQFRTQVYFVKRLDDKVTVSTFARFRHITSWRDAYTRTYTENGKHTTTLSKSRNQPKSFANDRLYVTVRHADYGSVTLGRNISLVGGASWAGGYASILGVYDAAWLVSSIGGFATDKSVKYTSKVFDGKHQFVLGVDQHSGGNFTAYGAGYEYNFADDGGTFYAYGTVLRGKSSLKRNNPNVSLDEFGTEVGYYGSLGKRYSHVVYAQFAKNKSYNRLAGKKVYALGYSGIVPLGDFSAYFLVAATRDDSKSGGVKTKKTYYGSVLGTSYRFFSYQTFNLRGYLEYSYQGVKTKLASGTSTKTNTHDLGLGLRLNY